MNLIPVSMIFVAIYLVLTLFLCRGLKLGVRQIALAGMTCTLVILLTYIRIPLPIGTAVTFEFIPLMLLALLVDPRLAMVTGVATGVLAAMIAPGWSIIHWAQFALEHLVCFSCMGYAGLFGRSRVRLTAGILLAMAIKLTGHFLSGAIFYGQYAWAGWGPWAYSLVYNLSYVVPDCIVAIILMNLMPLERLSKAIGKGARA